MDLVGALFCLRQTQDASARTHQIFLNIVFPDTYNLPAIASQHFVDFAITLMVRGDLPLPETTAIARHDKMLRALVPKAAINKYCYSSVRNNKVGPAWKSIFYSVAHAQAPKSLSKAYFGKSVTPTDAGHTVRALCGCQNVHGSYFLAY